jgi:hypothetical protein
VKQRTHNCVLVSFQLVPASCNVSRCTCSYRSQSLHHVPSALLRDSHLSSRSTLNSPLNWPSTSGHYVVVVAYCADTDAYVIRDPAAEAEHATVAASVFEAARRSFGTDEDIILVRLFCILLFTLAQIACRQGLWVTFIQRQQSCCYA